MAETNPVRFGHLSSLCYLRACHSWWWQPGYLRAERKSCSLSSLLRTGVQSHFLLGNRDVSTVIPFALILWLFIVGSLYLFLLLLVGSVRLSIWWFMDLINPGKFFVFCSVLLLCSSLFSPLSPFLFPFLHTLSLWSHTLMQAALPSYLPSPRGLPLSTAGLRCCTLGGYGHAPPLPLSPIQWFKLYPAHGKWKIIDVCCGKLWIKQAWPLHQSSPFLSWLKLISFLHTITYCHCS